MTKEKLEQWSAMDIRSIPREDLVEIRTVHIDPFADLEERRDGYFDQVKNPYCFLCDNTPVKISFSDEKYTLYARLARYFSAHKQE